LHEGQLPRPLKFDIICDAPNVPSGDGNLRHPPDMPIPMARTPHSHTNVGKQQIAADCEREICGLWELHEWLRDWVFLCDDPALLSQAVS